jgi:hypothetical protein
LRNCEFYQKFCFKFIQDKGCPDPDVWDPTGSGSTTLKQSTNNFQLSFRILIENLKENLIVLPGGGINKNNLGN